MIALILVPPLPRLTCIVVWPVLIYQFELYYVFIYCCDEKIKIRTAGICELKGIGYYIDYSHASLTTMETSARMLCVILAYGVTE